MNEVKMDWITKSGLRAVVLFVDESHHCGYVGIGKEHPLHGTAYNGTHPALKWDALEGQPMGKRGVLALFCASPDEAPRLDAWFDVHGSLTYSDGGDTYPAASDGLWWFGYDCSHAGDKCLGRRADYTCDGEFRDLDYCVNECERLAEQIEAVRHTAARCAV